MRGRAGEVYIGADMVRGETSSISSSSLHLLTNTPFTPKRSDIIMQTFTILATLALAATTVIAVDNREVFTHPDSDGKKFCQSWKCAW
jgi:hypothetical protein